MAENLSLSPSLRRQPFPLVVHSLISPLDLYPRGPVHSFTLIALAIGFRAFLDRKSNTSLSSHKTILELSLLFQSATEDLKKQEEGFVTYQVCSAWTERDSGVIFH